MSNLSPPRSRRTFQRPFIPMPGKVGATWEIYAYPRVPAAGHYAYCWIPLQVSRDLCCSLLWSLWGISPRAGTRRARFRKLLFNTTEVYEAISKAPSTPGEIVTMVSATDLRRELIGFTQIKSADGSKVMTFTKWNKKSNRHRTVFITISNPRRCSEAFSFAFNIVCK
jgi:hypothetical protein